MKIIIALPLLSYNDAICNDVRQQAKLLKKAGFDTVIYASESKQNLTQQLIPLDEKEQQIHGTFKIFYFDLIIHY